MAVFTHVATAWFAEPVQSLDQLVRETFGQLRSLAAEPDPADAPPHEKSSNERQERSAQDTLVHGKTLPDRV
jgi:hypothetical protein